MPWRLPSESDLQQLLDKLSPPPPAGTPSPQDVATTLQNAATANTDFITGLNNLAQLDWPGIWQVIETLSSAGPTLDGQTYLEIVESACEQLPDIDQRLRAAMIAELLSKGGRIRTIAAGTVSGWMRLTLMLLDLDLTAQVEVLGHLSVPPEAAEGVLAELMAEALDSGLDPIFSLTAPGGLTPAPAVTSSSGGVAPAATMTAAVMGPPAWLLDLAGLLAGIDNNANTWLDYKKPGGMPRGAYLGTEIHKAIAAYYQAAHAGHAVWTNVSTVRSILAVLQTAYAFQGSRIALALALAKPDIFEFGFEHGMPPGWVFEIKPLMSVNLAEFEAQFYAFAMTMCDIPVIPGPIDAPGTRGVVPAPGGWAAFVCAEPGAIVYRIRRASKQAVAQRVPVPDPAESKARDNAEQIVRASGQAATAVEIGLIAGFLVFMLEWGWVLLL
jgi:hypothetical protein